MVAAAVFLVCYFAIGFVVAVRVTRHDSEEVDMSDVAVLPFLFWPAFVFSHALGSLVRLFVPRKDPKP